MARILKGENFKISFIQRKRFLWFIQSILQRVFCSILSLFKKSSSAKILCYSSCSFLLPFSKRIQRTNRLRILLILSFSLLPKRIQRTNHLRILLILSSSLYTKDFKGLTAWDIFCFTLPRFQRTNRLRYLCPNTEFKELTVWAFCVRSG